MEVVSCSSGGPSPVNSTSSIAMNTTPNHINSTNTQTNNINSNNSNDNSNIVSVTPKVEHSPPENYERQTVLMWGTTSGGDGDNESTTTTTTTPTVNLVNRSPSNTSTSNGFYDDAQQIKINEHSRPHTNNMKWNGTMKGNNSTVVSEVHIYELHQQNSSDAVDSNSIYTDHNNVGIHHPSGGHITAETDHQSHHQSSHSHPDIIMQSTMNQDNANCHHPHQHHIQSQQQTHLHTIGSNSSCEVWSSAPYSQYQYFTYHHAPQHASTQ